MGPTAVYGTTQMCSLTAKDRVPVKDFSVKDSCYLMTNPTFQSPKGNPIPAVADCGSPGDLSSVREVLDICAHTFQRKVPGSLKRLGGNSHWLHEDDSIKVYRRAWGLSRAMWHIQEVAEETE
ncbi:hypothetical protein P7K49_008949 [Saguinus oedipus]|uniref:Uncharacterized protein n=1 Tax=Saguinus oedipus TaxID=9490 RepID=A0ABQ9W1L7_SAGOE|nr:hypothetical protein P7K49_008949 [Saguinus oedipus]